MKPFLYALFCFCLFTSKAQIKGNITDVKGKSIPFVNVYLEKFLSGTSANQKGKYQLNISKNGKYTIVFQSLGYKTLKKEINITSQPYTLNVNLEEMQLILDEVVIKSGENAAHRIIKKAIEYKEKHIYSFDKYTADFYSKGMFKIDTMPDTFMGVDIKKNSKGLKNNKGIAYLSETFSKIYFQSPNDFKEHIIASKVSGRDNGISFNRASKNHMSFYQNTVEIMNKRIISPISDNAFGYYKYKLLGAFHNKDGNLINKIQVKRKNKFTSTFEGIIYISEEDWGIYGVDLSLSDYQLSNPILKKLKIKQNYTFNKNHNSWILIGQHILFNASIFTFEFSGDFFANYSNYNFNPKLSKDDGFFDEILSFDQNATKKDSIYWSSMRPVPLTLEEQKDYTEKDSIRIAHQSPEYLKKQDSIRAERNKFGWFNIIGSYLYTNRKFSFRKGSLLNPISYNFNTVQGFNISLKNSFNYFHNDENLSVSLNLNYGLAEKKLRPYVKFKYKWDNINYSYFSISGGNSINQFNYNKPIWPLFNTLLSLLSGENYMKLYDKTNIKLSYYTQFKNFNIYTSLEFANRKPLVNHTHQSFVKSNNLKYTSNNPLNPNDDSPAFEENHIYKFNILMPIYINRKYISYPNSREYIRNTKYPIIYISYEKGFAASQNKLNYDFFSLKLTQNIKLSYFGNFKYYMNAGIFLDKKDIAFMDYIHFNDNQIKFKLNNLEHFNLLDYYKLSTNDKSTEFHLEHNFKGYILDEIPLINYLNSELVIGAKTLVTGGNKPYSEISVGISDLGYGLFKMFRIDYVKSFFGKEIKDGFILSIKSSF